MIIKLEDKSINLSSATFCTAYDIVTIPRSNNYKHHIYMFLRNYYCFQQLYHESDLIRFYTDSQSWSIEYMNDLVKEGIAQKLL